MLTSANVIIMSAYQIKKQPFYCCTCRLFQNTTHSDFHKHMALSPKTFWNGSAKSIAVHVML